MNDFNLNFDIYSVYFIYFHFIFIFDAPVCGHHWIMRCHWAGGAQECKHQFKNRRWNCSTIDDNTVFGPVSGLGKLCFCFLSSPLLCFFFSSHYYFTCGAYLSQEFVLFEMKAIHIQIETIVFFRVSLTFDKYYLELIAPNMNEANDEILLIYVSYTTGPNPYPKSVFSTPL